MKYILLPLLILCSTIVKAQLTKDLDYPSFFAKHDLVFDSLSNKWEEGAFLGNGLLGLMVYREGPDAIRFDLGRTDVVDHREGINPSIGRARLPIGRFVLHATSAIQSIHLRLDLWNAELYGSVQTANGTFQLHTLVLATKDVILIRTYGMAGKSLCTIQWVPEPAVSPFLTLGRDSLSKYAANPAAVSSVRGDIHYHEQPLLAGGSFTTAWKTFGSGSNKVLAATISNSFPGSDSRERAKVDLAVLSEKGIAVLLTAHRQKWHQYYRKSFISIPDKRLESFWWIQQYKMGSATRVGAYPIDLMGPWYKSTPWPKYWWNLNIQLTYYPFFSSNHVDLVQPLLKMIDDHLDTLASNAPLPYQHNSAALGRSGPYDMKSGIKVLRGNDSTGSPASLELGNLSWLLHVYWQSYEYTMDKRVMRSIYPVLTRAVNYYLNIAQKESDGKYHLPYTYSPEYPKGITRDANYDLSVLRWGLQTLLYIDQQLQLNDPLVARWKDLLSNQVAYPQDENGLRIGRDASFTLSHRHYSHLLMIYPIYDMNWDQPENRALIVRSLEQWKNHDEAWRGYSYTGSGSIYAMMGQGDSTWKLLNEMMKGRFSIKPNTMYLEAGPVIETPLSAVTTMNEMLLQSWGGVIRVFPAIPVSWEEASFDKLLAKGAFEVSAVRKNGQTQFIKIKSLAGQPCQIKTGGIGPVHATGNRKYNLSHNKDGIVSVDLKQGEEVILYAGKKPTNFAISAASAPKSNKSSWGLHKL